MQRRLQITVEGKQYEVLVEELPTGDGDRLYSTAPMRAAAVVSAPAPAAPPPPAASAGPAAATDRTAPLGGVIVSIAVKEGAKVNQGDLVAEIEAMKMKTGVHAHRGGTVSGIAVKVGDAVEAGQRLMTIS
ncbi:MAG: biotin/lipoyl-binding protein [Magnetococcales bacterium]|nr:biotin/lipoyl-binding protein [Magnetococcales bacterium]MBF0157575.1 biotin/lipoyl-binding protein [Magnetococcales bacterium]